MRRINIIALAESPGRRLVAKAHGKIMLTVETRNVASISINCISNSRIGAHLEKEIDDQTPEQLSNTVKIDQYDVIEVRADLPVVQQASRGVSP